MSTLSTPKLVLKGYQSFTAAHTGSKGDSRWWIIIIWPLSPPPSGRSLPWPSLKYQKSNGTSIFVKFVTCLSARQATTDVMWFSLFYLMRLGNKWELPSLLVGLLLLIKHIILCSFQLVPLGKHPKWLIICSLCLKTLYMLDRSCVLSSWPIVCRMLTISYQYAMIQNLSIVYQLSAEMSMECWSRVSMEVINWHSTTGTIRTHDPTCLASKG